MYENNLSINGAEEQETEKQKSTSQKETESIDIKETLNTQNILRKITINH